LKKEKPRWKSIQSVYQQITNLDEYQLIKKSSEETMYENKPKKRAD